ncbi:MAG: P-loop NTPase fold protein [Janthinobacterium lividum]
MTSTAIASYQPSPVEPAPRPEPRAPDALPVFASDAAGATDLDRRAATALLAEVGLHRHAETPLAIGIFGPAGSGKSHFLGAILDSAAQLAEAARDGSGQSTFVSRVILARIDAAPGRGAAPLLVEAALDALAENQASLAEEAVHAGGDPREAARLAGERVNALRRSLDSERQTLDSLGARRARLTETVLFDGAGSRVDGFARSNRGRIEARLRAFGLPTGDPVRTFKELVRDGAETSGGGSKLGLALRALWGFKGQGTLLVLAVLLGVLGWAAGSGADDPDAMTRWLAGFGDHFAAVTDWARGHLDLLQPASRIALALAALALLAAVVRAARFLEPIFRGIALLKGDLAERRRDLDGLLAHQTRRVDTLAREAETAGHGAEEAHRRAESRQGSSLSDHGAALARELFGLARPPEAAAEGFFAKLSQGMAAESGGGPERMLFAIDGLDRLAPAEAAAFLSTAHRLLARDGFVMLVTLERDQIGAALSEFDPALAAARLDRAVQLSYDLGPAAPDPAELAERLLDRRVVGSLSPLPVDPSQSALDRPLQPFETELVKRLAPFTGGTPRSIKRFVNAYRVARADPRLVRAAPGSFAMLAMALALDGTGAGSELTGFDADIAAGRLAMDQTSDFGRAFGAAVSATGPEIGTADMRRGLAVAQSFSRRG